ncbi:MAG: IS200/IS605 family transposase [Verrucomicrobiaceae bacterium]
MSGFEEGRIEPRIYEYIGWIIRSEGGHLVKIGGVEDHVHLLVSLGPKHCLSDLIRVVKSKATRWVREIFRVPKDFAWQEGFGSFTVSRSGCRGSLSSASLEMIFSPKDS